MPSIPTTPNLKLWLPTPDVYDSPSPNWGELLNQNFQRLAAAVPTKDNPLTPAAMNINADLNFNGFSPLELFSARFNDQPGTLASSVLRALYFVNGDFWLNNGAGTAVRITNGSSIVGTGGSIGGLPSTPAGAAVVYSNANGYTFTGFGGNFYSPLKHGPVTLFDTAAGPAAHGITLASPLALAADMTLLLPPALPNTGQLLPLLFDDSGNGIFAAIEREQMGAQFQSAVSITGANWSGSLSWWQDQVGLVHLQGYVQSAASGSLTATIATIPVAPLAPGVVFIVPTFDVFTAPSPGYIQIDSSGKLTALGTIPHTQKFYLDVVAYLGNN